MDVISTIEKKIDGYGGPYYFNLETGEKYGEIVGGLLGQRVQTVFWSLLQWICWRMWSWMPTTLGFLQKRMNLISTPF